MTVRLAATDNTGGSGVDKIYYTTDGSTPTTTDAAGNTTTSAPVTVTIR